MDDSVKTTLVRECKDYDPVPRMSVYEFEDGNKMEYLDVRHRVDWFNHWCHENGYTGTFDESQFSIHPDLGLIIATCEVKVNGECWAKASAGREFTGGGDRAISNAVQTAFTFAKGRALADIGFGTINSSPAEEGDSFPPDSGPRILPTPRNNPMMVQSGTPGTTPAGDAKRDTPQTATGDKKAASLQGSPEAGKRGRPRKTPESAKTSGKEKSSMPTNLTEAQATPIRFGTCKGSTLGEVWVRKPETIYWILSDKFGAKSSYPEEVEACRIIVRELGQK